MLLQVTLFMLVFLVVWAGAPWNIGRVVREVSLQENMAMERFGLAVMGEHN